MAGRMQQQGAAQPGNVIACLSKLYMSICIVSALVLRRRG